MQKRHALAVATYFPHQQQNGKCTHDGASALITWTSNRASKTSLYAKAAKSSKASLSLLWHWVIHPSSAGNKLKAEPQPSQMEGSIANGQ